MTPPRPEALPAFRYHPDPLASGSVVASAATCRCCGRARGHVYVGPVYAEEELSEAVCPWCIADGAAAEIFDAEFVDVACFPDALPDDAAEEIARRTPGYATWQGGGMARLLRPGHRVPAPHRHRGVAPRRSRTRG